MLTVSLARISASILKYILTRFSAYTLTIFKRLPPAQPVLQEGEQRPHQPPLRGCGRRLQL